MAPLNLVTAETFHTNPEEAGIKDVSPAAWSLVWHSKMFKGKPAHDLPTRKGRKTTYAFVSAGRWSARCLWCPSSEYASHMDHLFMCSACYNGDSYLWARVTWPDEPTIHTIDKLLSVRPIVSTRNWVVGEDVTDLAQENDEHGLPSFEMVDLPRPTKSLTERKLERMYAQVTSR